MRLVVLADETFQEELLSTKTSEHCQVSFARSGEEMSAHVNADAVIDLLFEQNNYQVSHLHGFISKPVFVNAVNKTIGEIGLPVIRINAWPGFLKRGVAEVSYNAPDKKNIENILTLLGKKTERVPDIRGFISARVVSMVINEAYFALEEQVSSKEEIDIAMKLGTNYPYGPFEWAKKIGLKNIAALLTELSLTEKRYQPAKLLLKEASL